MPVPWMLWDRIPGVNHSPAFFFGYPPPPFGQGPMTHQHVSSQGAVLMAAQLSRFGTGLLRLGLGGNDLKE